MASPIQNRGQGITRASPAVHAELEILDRAMSGSNVRCHPPRRQSFSKCYQHLETMLPGNRTRFRRNPFPTCVFVGSQACKRSRRFIGASSVDVEPGLPSRPEGARIVSRLAEPECEPDHARERCGAFGHQRSGSVRRRAARPQSVRSNRPRASHSMKPFTTIAVRVSPGTPACSAIRLASPKEETCCSQCTTSIT